MTSAEWDARFLSAKEQSLRSLAMTFAETQKDQHKGSLMNRRHSRKKVDDQGLGNAAASATRLPSRGNPLRTGDLVHLRGTGGGLTVTDEGYVVMRWAGDTADQKFVVEAAEDVERFGFSSALGAQCAQATFDKVPGVTRTVVGYTGGRNPRPTYDSVCAGDGHTEAIRVEYDPDKVSYDKLLDVFYKGCGAESSGKPQYKSAIWADRRRGGQGSGEVGPTPHPRAAALDQRGGVPPEVLQEERLQRAIRNATIFRARHVPSGGLVRLRALRDASLIRIQAPDRPHKADEEEPRIESWNLVTAPERGGQADPDTLFSLMLWREEEYRSARRFALSVRPLNKGCLEVRSFQPSFGDADVPSDFVEDGWRIAAINGRPATAEDELDDELISEDPATPHGVGATRSQRSQMMAARANSIARAPA
eukprot:s4358_g2.t1